MEVFLSYPSERLNVAREVYAFLGSVDVGVWFDKESLIAGQDWDRERAEAQKRADLTVLICSSETIARAGVIQREVQEILDLLKEKPLGQIYLVSVRTDDIRLPPELAKYQYVNHFEPDWKIKLARSLELKCNQAGTPAPQKLAQFFQPNVAPEPLTIKSFTESSDVLEVEAEFFTCNLNGDWWAFINSVIISTVYGGFYKARANFTEMCDFLELKNEWSIRVEEFFRQGEFVSLRMFVNWYGSGAAHPNHGITTLNFGGSEIGQFGIYDLFAGEDETAKYLIQYVDLDLRRQHLSTEGGFEYLSFPTSPKEAWQYFEQISIDRTGLTINFSPYDVLAYVFGPQEVRIPWDMIRDKVHRTLLNGPLRDIVPSAAI